MPRTVAARDPQDDTVAGKNARAAAGKNARAAAGKNARAAVPKKSHDRTVATVSSHTLTHSQIYRVQNATHCCCS